MQRTMNVRLELLCKIFLLTCLTHSYVWHFQRNEQWYLKTLLSKALNECDLARFSVSFGHAWILGVAQL